MRVNFTRERDLRALRRLEQEPNKGKNGAALTLKQVADRRHRQFSSISEDKDKVKTISFTGSVENSAPVIFVPADEITSPVF